MTINTVLDQVAENKITPADALKIVIAEHMETALKNFYADTAVRENAQSAIQEIQASASVAPIILHAETPMTRCSCGHTVPTAQIMRASNGTSCPDCYDRMSE